VDPRITTQRLYQRDSYQRQCATVVTATRTIPGRGPAVALAETVFYPAGGGQPADRGHVDGLAVIDVVEEDGQIWHVLGAVAGTDEDAATAPPPGTRVVGSIDWDRRFDHMQQHTGQHILSQAFLQVLGAPTVSVHMERTCTLDVAIASLDDEGAARVEGLANRVVMDNRPVHVREVDDQEAVRLGLRRPPTRAGLIRVVEVEAFDRSACGGTHVRATAEVGPVLIRRWERHKGGVRVEFLCGWRAIRDYGRLRGLVREVTARLTTGEADVADAVRRLQDRVRDLERDLQATRDALLGYEAERLVEAAGAPPEPGGPRIVAAALADRSVAEVRALARLITSQPGRVAVLVSAPDRRVLVARSADVDLDAAAALQAAVGAFGGRGGGRAEAAEGAAPAAPSADALVEAARAAAAQRCRPAGR
jgi:alanyl-tRNA synthetase